MSRRLEGRNGQMYQAWIMGTTQEELAERHGISQERVSAIIRAVQAQIPETDLAESRKRHLDVLDRLGHLAADIAESPLAPAYSNGRMMVDLNGQPILDVGTRMSAVDRLLKIQDRIAKTLGLDAPTKVDVALSESSERKAAEVAAEAIARLHGGTGDE